MASYAPNASMFDSKIRTRMMTQAMLKNVWFEYCEVDQCSIRLFESADKFIFQTFQCSCDAKILVKMVENLYYTQNAQGKHLNLH